ncbi:MAG: SIMPL domain-containing protein [Paracoccaceae bacterium]
MSPVPPALAETGTLTVSGEGSVQSVPDIAALSLGVTSEGASAGAAMSANAAALQGVLDRLAAAGIESGDIQTANLSLNPNWTGHETGAPRITGFTAMNLLTITVRDLAVLGPVLDAAIGAGANTLNGIEFRLSAPQAALAEARRRAVVDAMARAETLAGAAGVSLGPILSIIDGAGQGAPVPMFRLEAAMDAGIPTAAGQVGVSASVTLVFALDQ